MVDYSKWDNFNDSSDEGSIDERHTTPRVTRLNAPSTIKTSNDGSIHISPIEPSVSKTVDDASKLMVQEEKARGNVSKRKSLEVPNHWIREGSRHKTDDGFTYFWCQDRITATLRIRLPSKDNEKKFNVKLTNALSYRDRHVSAMATPGSQSLHISNSNTTLMDRVLAHPVHLAEHDEDVDWCIQSEDGFDRVLSVTLNKATPMANMVVWWKRMFVGDNEREETERNMERQAKQEQLKDAWREAHEQFRANVRSRKGDK